jgi:hypothetical protein
MSLSIFENIFFGLEHTFILTRVYWIIMQQIYFFLEKFFPTIMHIFDLKYWPTIATQLFRISIALSFGHTVVQKYVRVEKRSSWLLNDPLTIRFLAGVKRERIKVLVSGKLTNLCRSKNSSIAYFIIQIIPISLWLKIRKRLVFIC